MSAPRPPPPLGAVENYLLRDLDLLMRARDQLAELQQEMVTFEKGKPREEAVVAALARIEEAITLAVKKLADP